MTRTTEPHIPDEENEWIAAAQRGDSEAPARLVERYWDRLFRWLYQMTRDRHKAEDLTQETFLKAFTAIHSFQPGTNFRAWLFRIAHNNFVNLKRSEKRLAAPLLDLHADGTPGPEVDADDRDTLGAVRRAIEELPADFRSALLLRAVEELSFKEIAAILNTTEETARWRVFKARQKLLTMLPTELIPAPMGGGDEK